MAQQLPQNDRMYQLLPAVYRERDAQERYPLRALLRLINAQADIVQADMRRLWDDFFIETCQRWAIPYIGDLVGNRLLHDLLPDVDTAAQYFTDLVGPNLLPASAVRLRADVAKTIYYRRRKGTVPMLEQLAADVTGWAAHVDEFFQNLVWSQNLNHLRLFSSGCPDIRSVERDGRVDGPFDAFSHTVDVRAVAQEEGWYNIHNIGFFLWRLGSYPLQMVPARVASQPWQYHFSPLGNPAPLFTRWRRVGEGTAVSTELSVPGPIRPAFFFRDLDSYAKLPPTRPDFTDLYGLFEPFPGSLLEPNPEVSLAIIRNNVPVAPSQDPTAPFSSYKAQIVCRQLKPWPAAQPSGQIIAVDVANGRMAIGDGWGNPTTSVDVFYHYGFSANLGSGPYERRNWLVNPALAQNHYYVSSLGSPLATHPSVTAALADWVLASEPNTIITILDSRTYAIPAKITLSNEHWLVIEADNFQRPLLQADPSGLELAVLPPADPNNPQRSAEFTLSGVVVEGFVHVTGDLGRLRLLHGTLVPGRSLTENGAPTSRDPSVVVEEKDGAGNSINAQLRVEMAFSITGPLRLPENAQALLALDSIIDGLPFQGGLAAVAATGSDNQPGPPTTLERVTIFGASYFKQLSASESIFTGVVTTSQRQEGCVRFCFVPDGSTVPRRYRCQPDPEIAEETAAAEKQAKAKGTTLTAPQKKAIHDAVVVWLKPTFTAEEYGLPGYAQLRLGCPEQIRTGTENESEMGVFCHLQQPQRETNLRIRLEEYLPFGLDAGLIYVT
jgi:hypothetical protein